MHELNIKQSCIDCIYNESDEVGAPCNECAGQSFEPIAGTVCIPAEMKGTEVHMVDMEKVVETYINKEQAELKELHKDIKDSGGRTEFETGAVRDAQGGKGRFDLIPLLAVWALAHHTEKGCKKYGDRNWEKGIPIKNYMDSGMRHMVEAMLGLTDENHLAAALWNIACAYETKTRIDMGLLPKSLDEDIPYILKGVIKDSEDVKAWDRLKK
jgi:hypothetical protein